ncbi:MAG: alpha/beta hydrolase [Robiginitomaculum sp.]|nr:alpha/beta hydrolase [Robiginitomaculum sp.]
MLDPAPIIELDDDPAPKRIKAFWFKSADGLRLRAAICPPDGTSKGSILFSPGRTEYIEKYFEFIRQMNAKGLTVAVIDHRGQGLSDRLLTDPLLGYVASFSDFAMDMETLWPLIEERMPTPRFLMSHSMGGAIAIDVLRRKKLKFEKLIASAPMLGFAEDSFAMRALVAVFSAIGLKRLQPPGVSGGGALDPEAAKVLTSDPVRFDRDLRRCKQQPKLQLGGPTIGWLKASLLLFKSFTKKDGFNKIDTPVYFGCAEREALVSNSAIRQACQEIPNAEFEIYQDSLHEILQERDEIRDKFMAKTFKLIGV